MRIDVERDSCIASGSCTFEAPEVYGQDDDGVVVLLQAAPPAHLADSARGAMAACPAAVISIDETG